MDNTNEGTIIQRKPIEGDDVVLNYVIEDLVLRSKIGKEKYGTELKTFNGRDALIDAYQEQLDNICYTKQLILERKEELDRLVAAYSLITQNDTMISGVEMLSSIIKKRLNIK